MPRSKEEQAAKIPQETFVGGESIDFRNGINGAILQSEAMDFRQKASQMSVLPGAFPISTNLKDLPTAMCQTPDGVRYLVGDQGWIYRESINKVVSVIGQLNDGGGAGIVYNQQSDQLYIAGQRTVSIYGQIMAGSPKLVLDNFGPSASTANGTVNLFDSATNAYDIPRNNAASVAGGITLSNYASAVTNASTPSNYVLPSTIIETVGNFCPFIPDIEPFYSVPVYITTIGTGNLTLTMHDSLNNNLGAVIIPHANVVLGWNNFIFSSQVRAIPNAFATGNAAGYHFHLTSSTAADTAAVATINVQDLTGCNFLLFADRLVITHNGWHPMAIFGQYLVIGNGPYISTYNFANDAAPNNGQWVRHQLSLDFGFEVCGLSVNNQMLVTGAEKRSTQPTRNYQDGYLYFWDGANVNFNNKIEVPYGAPYGLSSKDNVSYFVAGGSLFAYGGGQLTIKVRYIAYQNTDYLGVPDSTIVNPNMMAIRYGILLVGYPSSTTNVNLKYGVYTWGAVELTYPNSFGYSYAPSIRASQNLLRTTPATNLQIGMVYNFVDTMYISWRYTDGNSVTHYGLDVVDNTSTPAANYSAWNLVWDGSVRWKIKRGLRVKINFLPLPTATTLTVGFILDRSTTPDAFNASIDPTASASAKAGDTSVVVQIDTNFYEATWGVIGTCVTGTGAPTAPPTITGWACEVDILSEAQDLRADEIPVGTNLAGD
jgi:hypothetical protein